MHPAEFVTVKVNVPPGIPVTVVVVPVPEVVVPPGDIVTVQVPVAGKPLNAAPPESIAQVGCVIVPVTGADGALIITIDNTFE